MFVNYGLVTLMIVFQVSCLAPDRCDPSLNAWFREGILGQVGMFPWLGVIRVKLYEGTNVRIALTGAILVKENFAITIADDIARIPRSIFKKDTEALFILNDDQSWLCQLKDYLTHPEYDARINTIALIELELKDTGPARLFPICWPTYLYNASNQLYVLGITDKNVVLEKEVYKVHYVKQSNCIRYYKRAKLHYKNERKRDYQCAYATNSTKHCVWENGMVLASNATGTWVLIGFGIHGPGCASPARFIEMYQYLPWIEASTSKIQYPGTYNRHSALREGFGKKIVKTKDIPVHHFFRTDTKVDAGVEADKTEGNRTIDWIFDKFESGVGGEYEVERIDKDAIIIFQNRYELERGDCLISSKKLIYVESFKMHADTFLRGTATYQLSLMDLSVRNYTCVVVRINAEKKSSVRLWYNYGSNIETLDTGEKTPAYLLKKYPIPDIEDTTKTNLRSHLRARNKHLRTHKLLIASVVSELDTIKNELDLKKQKTESLSHDKLEKSRKKLDKVTGKLANIKTMQGAKSPRNLNNSIITLRTVSKDLKEMQGWKDPPKQKHLTKQVQRVQDAKDLIKKLDYQTETSQGGQRNGNEERSNKAIEDKDEGMKEKPKWKPHKYLEPEFITDRPGWWLVYPHLNLQVDFQFSSVAELKLEVWSHLLEPKGTTPPPVPPTRTRTGPTKATEGTTIGMTDPATNTTSKTKTNNAINNATNNTTNTTGESFLRNKPKFGPYLQLRKEENDFEIARVRVDKSGKESKNAGHLVRSDGLCVLVVFSWLILLG